MNIISLYNNINYSIILVSITIFDSLCIIAAYKNGNYYDD